ncbi:MAG: UbiD family decarboxylase, partial [Dehalococcoidia bacterium]|nr:UbiD family decarboxylase [Dehalococcoidia bacterium]
MAFRDLREFLGVLEEKGELIKLKKELEDGYEVSALAWELAERSGPAVQFHLKGYDIPLVMGLHGTLRRNCIALGLEPKESDKENYYQIRNFIAGLLESKDKWIKPVKVDKAPCQEVSLTGAEVDLGKLPVAKWSPMDGGPYITLTNI